MALTVSTPAQTRLLTTVARVRVDRRRCQHEVSFFTRNSKGHLSCRECHRLRSLEYRRRNPERVREQAKRSEEKCKDKIRLRRAQWYLKNQEAIRAKQRDYLEKNRDKRNAREKVRRSVLLAEAVKALGGDSGSLLCKCACCDKQAKYGKMSITIDHITPVRGEKREHPEALLKAVIVEPSRFQFLCQGCNTFKSTGPCCPCKFWDAKFPSWRE